MKGEKEGKWGQALNPLQLIGNILNVYFVM